MVKYKDNLVSFQLFFCLLIPLTPHINISKNLQVDDIPVLIFFLLFLINYFLKNIKRIFLKETLPLFLFFSYISIQNLLINNQFIFSESLRYLFYILLFITILNIDDLAIIDNFFKYLMIFVSFFSILFYILEINLGSDAYDYWKIGFNENQWIFTNGRMNGLQAGGPNAFGALIACLTVFTVSKFSDTKYNYLIFLGVLGCFFTYSRASIVILILILLFYFFSKTYFLKVGLLFASILITINFGFIERITSEAETQGIEDRIQMQQASVSDISSRNISQNIFGYGHNNFGLVRDEIKSLDQFSKDLRPTGPHNSFLFVVLDYGFFGLILFLNIFLNAFIKFLHNFKVNIFKSEYLFLGAFVALSFTGDFIQNHSISVLFFLMLFKTIKDFSNE